MTQTDLQYQYRTRKTDYSWFQARLRLAEKAIKRNMGIDALRQFMSKAGHVYDADQNTCAFCGDSRNPKYGIPMCDTCHDLTCIPITTN